MLLLAVEPGLSLSFSRCHQERHRQVKALGGGGRRGQTRHRRVCIGRKDAKHTLCNGLQGGMIHGAAIMHLYTNFNYANGSNP